MHRRCKFLQLTLPVVESAANNLTSARLHVQVSEVCLQAQHVQIEGREEYQALNIWTACVFNPL